RGRNEEGRSPARPPAGQAHGEEGWYRGAAAGPLRPFAQAIPRKATQIMSHPDDSAPVTSAPGSRRPFPALPDRPYLPALEREMLVRWSEGKVFERSLEQTADGPQWTFYEGPPTAHGVPGGH